MNGSLQDQTPTFFNLTPEAFNHSSTAVKFCSCVSPVNRMSSMYPATWGIPLTKSSIALWNILGAEDTPKGSLLYWFTVIQ